MAIDLSVVTKRRSARRRHLTLVEHRHAASAGASFDRDYWIAHCDGYRVDDGGGRIGFVEQVGTEQGRPVLEIRTGLLGRRVIRVPAAEIAFIVPRAKRVWLGPGGAQREEL